MLRVRKDEDSQNILNSSAIPVLLNKMVKGGIIVLDCIES